MCGGLLYFIWLVAFSEHLYYAMRYLLDSEYYYCHIPYNIDDRVFLTPSKSCLTTARRVFTFIPRNFSCDTAGVFKSD